MKFVNYLLFTTLFLITVVQFGCVSINLIHSAEELVDAKDYSTKVYPFPDGGIDPYEFLGFTR